MRRDEGRRLRRGEGCGREEEELPLARGGARHTAQPSISSSLSSTAEGSITALERRLEEKEEKEDEERGVEVERKGRVNAREEVRRTGRQGESLTCAGGGSSERSPCHPAAAMRRRRRERRSRREGEEEGRGD